MSTSLGGGSFASAPIPAPLSTPAAGEKHQHPSPTYEVVRIDLNGDEEGDDDPVLTAALNAALAAMDTEEREF